MPLTLPVRLALAAVVVTWGALTDRRGRSLWQPPSGCLSSGCNALAMVVAIVPLVHPTWLGRRLGLYPRETGRLSDEDWRGPDEKTDTEVGVPATAA